MRRALKIFLITLLSLLAVALIAVSITLWLIFTPERLTPIVRKQADKMLTCQSQIGEVELTFFSTFPQFGLKISDFALINPTPGAQNDTLVAAQQMLAIVDVDAWRKRKEIHVNELKFTNGTVNVFVDSTGINNYSIFPVSEVGNIENNNEAPETEELPITIDGISIVNTNISYIDHVEKMYALIDGLHALINAAVEQNVVRSDVKIHRSVVSFNYFNEQYLLNTPVQMHLLSDFVFDKQELLIDNLKGVLNDVDLQMSGSIAYDSHSKDTSFGLSFILNKSPLARVLELVPPSFQSYYEGIEADGLVASTGSVIGIYNQNEMPLVDMSISLENGTLGYVDVPLKLHDVFGEITFTSDLLSDAATVLHINNFDAKTPQSQISTKGTVTQLFSDIHLDLQSNGKLTLEEFKPFIPENLNIEMKGKASGKIQSAFTLAQLEKFEIDKMKLAGTLSINALDAVYDSIFVKSDQTNIEFSLPAHAPQSANTAFISASVFSQNFSAFMPDSFDVALEHAFINIEMSDVMDTTRVPDIICSFNIDALSASMDTMSIALTKPIGRIMLAPGIENPDIIGIEMAFSSNEMNGKVGQSFADIAKMNIESNIVYDSKQEDIFLQWQPQGLLNMEKGYIVYDGFNYDIEIPSIKLDFTPETFNIEESSIVLDRSDFRLSGTLVNVLSYFREDSILRGNFNFESSTTDVMQIMNLTSGIGYEEVQVEENGGPVVSDAGPYMVPKGIDITLNTKIDNASFGIDSATNITGIVRVYDGILLLDEMRLVTPAARMQLTAMYRTPRKNHLFLGLDYHMLDVEISELLSMIPEVDSLMPMLRSFGGEGEFHLAIETYLDSTYNLKMSTLRGAASVAGQDLVLMDGETFSEIAKTLRFTKQAENRVDSLSAEFTIFREEIDVYPFLIVMDRYKAIVAGRHNFDMSFDYHISLVESPLPIQLGVDVRGTMDNMSYRPARPRYAEKYRPAARFAVSNKQMELRKIIRESLTQNMDW